MPFLKYNANPLDRRGNDCTIRAISLFTGKTWDEVYIGVTAEGFDLKDMPSTNEIWNRYLKREITPKVAISFVPGTMLFLR